MGQREWVRLEGRKHLDGVGSQEHREAYVRRKEAACDVVAPIYLDLSNNDELIMDAFTSNANHNAEGESTSWIGSVLENANEWPIASL